MPRVGKTRADRAKDLLARLSKGPGVLADDAVLRARYTLWVRALILPEVEDLVPELRQAKKEAAHDAR